MMPLVSVLMPVYNRERYLAEAIESMLAQDYRPLEIIVVDDGSTDSSAAIAQRYGDPVRYDYQPHGGIANARNRSLALARGEYLAFLDSDDLWEGGALAKQMEVIRSDPDLAMVFGYVIEFISPELDQETAAKLGCHPEPMPSQGPGAIVKAEAFRTVGPFRTEWQIGEFMDWQLRAKERGLKSRLLSEVVLRRRVHPSNTGVEQRDSRGDYLRILKASLDRRRNEPPA